MADTSHPAGLDRLYAADAEPEEPLPFRAFTRRRILTATAVLLVLLALVVVPPLINVGRYKRQIASSIGSSLGRPVHIDNVTLNLLPVPGFTLENFVVGEDPAFGAEPVLRAEQVRVNLRFRSLWHRRLEFSRIALSEPSINLVHLPDGRWNFESILLQASRIPAAPTAQSRSGNTPRFPYIEANGARLNLKRGVEKTPFSLTEADLALWLPDPGVWHLRVKAHPTRTDTAVSDTGLVRIDGTLSQAATLADVPLDLRADWTAAPLGAVSTILSGRDRGMRGTMNLHATLDGTLARNTVSTQLALENVRRADFVPRRSLSASVQCTARTANFLHAVEAAHCVWPGEVENTGLSADLHIAEITNAATATGTLTLDHVPAEALLDGLRIASNRISPELSAGGLISGSLPCCGPAPKSPPAAPDMTLEDGSLALPGQAPFVANILTASLIAGPDGQPALQFEAIPLALGGPAPATLTVQLSHAGAHLQLTGYALSSRLLTLAEAFPQFGDGLPQLLPAATGPEAPLHLDLHGEHSWTAGQSWMPNAMSPAPQRGVGSPRRRHR